VLPERLLSKLWRAKAGAVLRTTDGRRVRVVYPGRPAPGHGPDFRDAVLEIDGAPVRGPVELHRVPADWLAHGHQDDPAYDDVVLHVVAQSSGSGPRSPAALTDKGGDEHGAERAGGTSAMEAVDRLPTVVLSGKERRRKGLPEIFKGLTGLDDATLHRRLTEAGLARFDERVEEAQRGIEAHGADQFIMARVMDCLGYSENRAPFGELARRAPYSILRAASRTGREGQRTAVMERLLLSGAGLAPVSDEWAFFVGTQPMRGSKWRVAGVRPSNHPRWRIAGLARLLSTSGVIGLAGWMRSASEGGVAALLGALTVRAENGSALVGDARAREVLVNAALPVLAAMGDERARCMYERAPSLPDNTVTREARNLVGTRKGLRLGACQQQGLLRTYREAVSG
jgi:hypothetical protein